MIAGLFFGLVSRVIRKISLKGKKKEMKIVFKYIIR